MASTTKSKGVELLKFGELDFNPDTFIKQNFDSSSTDAGKVFLQQLSDLKSSATADLQKSVHKHYHEFAMVTKEISQLENDMVTLKTLLSELRRVHEGLKLLTPASDRLDESLNVNLLAAAISNARRQSNGLNGIEPNVPAHELIDAYGKQYRNLEDLILARQKQMKELFHSIDGLQKIFPMNGIPRYLVKDGAALRFIDLSSASKSSTSNTQGVSFLFYLFNDCLVTVMKKKSMLTGKIKLSADKFFFWTDIAIIDLKDVESINDIKILRHPDQYVFRSETPDAKRLLLSLVKKITDDLVAEKKREKNHSLEQSKSNRESMSSQVAHFLEPRRNAMNSVKTKAPKMTDKEKRFLLDLPDDLDVLIVNREFEQAVNSIEKAESKFKMCPGEGLSMKTKIDSKKQKLVNLLSLQLANPDLHRNQVKWNIDRLLRLSLGEQARDIFLTARSMTIRHRIRQLKFVGDVSAYIKDLSEIVFRLIKNTCDWYGTSFREATMASGFINWVQSEIQNYAQVFRRQVFDANQDFETISVCLGHTMTECLQLKDVGLDLSFVLDKLFFQDVVKSIDAYDKTLELIDRDWNHKQYFCMMVSAGFIVDALLPKVATQLAVVNFDRPIPELEEHGQILQNMLLSIQSAYVRLNTAKLITKDFPFPMIDYTHGAAILENAKCSDYMVKLLSSLHSIAVDMPFVLDKKSILSDIIRRLFDFMVEDRCWENDKGPRLFGFGGVQQFILDIHLLLKVCDILVDEHTNTIANQICERALVLYFSQNKEMAAPLKDGEWYDKRVEDMKSFIKTTFHALLKI